MWNLPGSGTEPPSPALAGRVPLTVPPGKSWESILHMLADRKPILMLANHNSFSSLMINFLHEGRASMASVQGNLRFQGFFIKWFCSILWTWVWARSWSWWWTGRPGVLQPMGSQRVGHDWATELNWTYSQCLILCIFLFTIFKAKFPFFFPSSFPGSFYATYQKMWKVPRLRMMQGLPFSLSQWIMVPVWTEATSISDRLWRSFIE